MLISVPWWTSKRFCLSIICFVGFFCLYAQRVNLSIGIVCMVKNELSTNNRDKGPEYDNSSGTYVNDSKTFYMVNKNITPDSVVTVYTNRSDGEQTSTVDSTQKVHRVCPSSSESKHVVSLFIFLFILVAYCYQVFIQSEKRARVAQ